MLLEKLVNVITRKSLKVCGKRRKFGQNVKEKLQLSMIAIQHWSPYTKIIYVVIDNQSS